MTRRRGTGSRQRGQALAELAVVLPFLLLLFMGVVDVGRLLLASVAIEEAAQEGALYGAYRPTPSGDIIARVTSSSSAAEVSGASVTVVCSASPAPGTVTVTAEFDYELLTPIIKQAMGDTVRLRSSVVGTNFVGAC